MVSPDYAGRGRIDEKQLSAFCYQLSAVSSQLSVFAMESPAERLRAVLELSQLRYQQKSWVPHPSRVLCGMGGIVQLLISNRKHLDERQLSALSLQLLH
jgi:hypothetical protein